MKRLLAALLAALLTMSILPATAEENAWTCEVCGAEGNTGNFCTNCGALRPSGEWKCPVCGKDGNTGNFCTNCGQPRTDGSAIPAAATVTPKPTEALTPIPTAAPTATPKPRPSLKSSVSYSGGKTTISWDSNGYAGTCYVMMEAVNGTSKQHSWNLGNTSGTSLETGAMMPGKTYKVSLIDSSFETVDEKTYTLPEVEKFEDGKLKNTSVKVTIETRRMAAGTTDRSKAKRVNGLSASKIEESIRDEGDAFGFKYQMRMPTLIKSRTFYVTIYIESPDGYLEAEVWSDVTFDRVNNGYQTIWWNLLGDEFFKNLYDTLGEIPQGNYKVTMFWDGMFLNESTLKIGK